MADVELVIKIPEEVKRALDNNEEYRLYTESICNVMLTAIKNGTSLPKGHGRLIDADGLKYTFETEEDAEICKWSTYGVTSEIDDADTIIPAMKGE